MATQSHNSLDEARETYKECRDQIKRLKKRQDEAAEILRSAARNDAAPDGVTLSVARRRIVRDVKALVAALHAEGQWNDNLWQTLSVDVAKLERLLDGTGASVADYVTIVESERLNVK